MYTSRGTVQYMQCKREQDNLAISVSQLKTLTIYFPANIIPYFKKRESFTEPVNFSPLRKSIWILKNDHNGSTSS